MLWDGIECSYTVRGAYTYVVPAIVIGLVQPYAPGTTIRDCVDEKARVQVNSVPRIAGPMRGFAVSVKSSCRAGGARRDRGQRDPPAGGECYCEERPRDPCPWHG
jgi:hypothetical protein